MCTTCLPTLGRGVLLNMFASQAPWILIEDRPVKAAGGVAVWFSFPLFLRAGRTTAGKWYRAVTPHVRSEDASLKDVNSGYKKKVRYS